MATQPPVEIEHGRYLENARYRRDVHVRLIQAGEAAGILPLHDEDRACCRRQSWMRTMFAMGRALREDGYVLDIESVDELRG
jgi:hypothetical protein